MNSKNLIQTLYNSIINFYLQLLNSPYNAKYLSYKELNINFSKMTRNEMQDYADVVSHVLRLVIESGVKVGVFRYLKFALLKSISVSKGANFIVAYTKYNDDFTPKYYEFSVDVLGSDKLSYEFYENEPMTDLDESRIRMIFLSKHDTFERIKEITFNYKKNTKYVRKYRNQGGEAFAYTYDLEKHTGVPTPENSKLVKVLEECQIYETNNIIRYLSIHDEYNQRMKGQSMTQCFSFALRSLGVDQDICTSIATEYIGTSKLNLTDVRAICKKYSLNVDLAQYYESTKGTGKLHMKYNDNEPLQIALYKDHYFINKKVSDKELIAEFKALLPREIKPQSYLNLVRYMDKNNMFDPVESNVELMKVYTTFRDFNVDPYELTPNTNITSEESICYEFVDWQEYRELGKEKFADLQKTKSVELHKCDKKEESVIYLAADIESDVVTNVMPNGDVSHIPEMFGFCQLYSDKPYIVLRDKNSPKSFTGQVLEFIYEKTKDIFVEIEENTIKIDDDKTNTKKIVMWFHNAKYDTSLLFNDDEDIHFTGVVEDNETFYSRSFKYLDITFEIRDSMKYFNCPLEDLTDMFNLKIRKLDEIINYEFVTNETIQPSYRCRECDYDKKSKSTEIISPLKKYLIPYLTNNVLVLSEALIKFKIYIQNLTKQQIDPFHFLTIAAISFHFFKSRKCLNGVYKNTGQLKMYIDTFAEGGKVYCNPKYEKKIIEEKIVPLDVNSLYPTAYSAIGFYTGAPKIMTKEIFEECFNGNSNHFDVHGRPKIYGLMDVKIKRRDYKYMEIPLFRVMTKENQIRYVQGNAISDNQALKLTSYSLADLKEFHGVELSDLEFVCGIYWDGEINDKITEVTNELNLERDKYKKENNDSMSECIKMLLNAFYGKLGTKPRYESTRYMPMNTERDELLYLRTLSNNFENLKSVSYYQKAKQIRVIKKCKDKSYTFNHCSVAILSYSKHIMNRIIGIFTDCKAPIYYHHTDRIHCKQLDIEKVNSIYVKKYGINILGPNLGQSKIDFRCKILSTTKEKTNQIDPSNLSSPFNIYISERTYIEMPSTINDYISLRIHTQNISVWQLEIYDEYAKMINENSKDFTLKIYDQVKLRLNKNICFNETPETIQCVKNIIAKLIETNDYSLRNIKNLKFPL